MGHDVLTTQDAGNANCGMADEDVLEFCKNEQRIILTLNRKHFITLHRKDSGHCGIIVCTYDNDFLALAIRSTRRWMMKEILQENS